MTAQTVSSAVEKQQDGPVVIMWSRKKHFDAVLPASVDVEAFLGTAAGALYANGDLMDAAVANPDSLITVLMRCAALGHLPGTDEFYLYNRKRKGRPEVAGTEGYRGIIERMYRSGAVNKVVVREVCENDMFRYVEGIDDKPVHAIGGEGNTGAAFFTGRKRGEMVGVYAYAELATGAVSRVVLLTRDDVMAAKAASDAGESQFSPWNRLDGGKEHPEFTGRSMWWKTGARRLEPWVPTSREYRASMLQASAKAAEQAAGISARRAQPVEPPPARAITAVPEPADGEIADDTDPSPAGSGAPATAAKSAAPPAEAAPDEAVPAGEAAERPPALATTGQRSQLDTQRQRLGYGDSEQDWDDWLHDLAGLAKIAAIASPAELTQREAKDVIWHLKSLKDQAAVKRLLATGEQDASAEEAARDE